MIIARWKPGLEALHKGVDAQKVSEEILSIEARDGVAPPKAIVEMARDASTELHKCFTWHDHVAAEKWRLQEARVLVTHIIIEKRPDEGEEPSATVRYFHKVVAAEGSGYKSIEHIIHNVREYDQLLKQAKRDFIALRKKYETLSELEPIFDLIDELTE